MGAVELIINIKEKRKFYPLIIEDELLEDVPSLLKEEEPNAKYVLVTDSNVNKHHTEKFFKLMKDEGLKAEKIVIPPGEQTKSVVTYNNLMQKLIGLGTERSSILIAFGGGVIGDITGFAAATFMRGIKYLQIPTTLLSQVDSSIGGKTGINLPQGKNLIGAFHHPEKVFIDLSTLDTLPEDELRNGLVELVKHAIIKDKKLFYYLEDHLKEILGKKKDVLKTAIIQSLKIKKEIVEEDEKERDIRKLLNYGHTFGHAIESINNYKIAHGRAVCAGMILAAKLSKELGFIKDEELEEHNKILRQILKVDLKKVPANKMIDEMKKDKKRISGKLNFVLLKGIGKAFVTSEIPEDKLRKVLEEWL